MPTGDVADGGVWRLTRRGRRSAIAGLVAALVVVPIALAAPGDLDQGFGTGGIVKLPSGDKLPRVVTADNVTADQGGKQIGFALAADGTMALIGQPPAKPGQELRVEGATTPGQRKAVLSFLGALMK